LKRFWLSTALLFACTLALGSILSSLFEKKIYDVKARLFARPASAPIVLVEIDQESIDFYSQNANLPWPWPRSLYARAIDFLDAAGARVVGLDMVFSEPSPYGGEDDWLAASMRRSGRVFLPLFFSDKQGSAAHVERFALPFAPPLRRLPAREGKVTLPVPPIQAAMRGGGNAQDAPDRDNVYRRLKHFVVRRGRVFPSFSLALASFADPGLQLDHVPFAADGSLQLKFPSKGSFGRFSISALIQSQVRGESGQKAIVDPAVFRDKIVLIGPTALALLDNRPTPVNATGSGFELHATALANLLQRDFIRSVDPLWHWLLVLLAIILLNRLLTGIQSLQRQLLAALAVILVVLALDFLLFFLGVDLDLLPLCLGLVACAGYDAYQRYQRVRREKKLIEKAFKGYMSDALLAEVQKNPGGLRLVGQKKLVTVFFSDLAGFTTLSEKLPPEEVVSILNTYLERMTDVIMAAGGFVNKFEGDAIMAFWGAPLASERQASQAMNAALSCQEELLALNDEFARKGLPRLGMRVGINSGEVIVGNIGSQQRMEYTVIGDAVNLASRLEGINKQYGTRIICGALAGRMAAGEVLLRRLDRVRVKGKQVAEEIFEVVAGGDHAPAGDAGPLAAFAQGLQLYFSGDFSAALEVFMALADDPPAQVFAKRCLYLQDHPPADWDGCWTFTEK
jgi:adenylate cyclase